MKVSASHIILAVSTAFMMLNVQTVFANDGAYTMTGNQLVPMHTTQIDVKKEVLHIERQGNDIIVDVHYEMVNKGKPISLLVGFEAMPPSGDVDYMPVNGGHPYMSDFSAKINGKPVQYAVALVPTEGFWQQDDAGNYTLDLNKPSTPFYFQNGRISQIKEHDFSGWQDSPIDQTMYVYHFSANFKTGLNTIDHRYRFEPSGNVDLAFAFDYVLTAINRWGDSRIDDFELSIDMGDLVEFNIPNTFFKDGKEWQINGTGKQYPNTSITYHSMYTKEKTPSTTFAIRDGEIVFRKTDFTPHDELFLYIPAMSQYQSSFDANHDNLYLNYSAINSIEWSDIADEFSYKVLRNHPFARRGYVFSNPKIQAFFERQPWYIPEPSYRADYNQLDNVEKQFISTLDSYYKDINILDK